MESKEKMRDDEVKQLKGRVNQIESRLSEDHHHIVKRQNSITSSRLPCIPKNACAFDFKNTSAVTGASLEDISKPNNLPSSCKDLTTNGHTSNGIYLLYDSNVKKVTTAFCDFKTNKGNEQSIDSLF